MVNTTTTTSTTTDSQTLADALQPLLEVLADRIADRVLGRLQALPAVPAAVPARRLLTLGELVNQLPPGKKPETWKRWLYQRTRHNQIPGQVKLGNRLFFDAEITLPWLETGCTAATLAATTEESLHVAAMREKQG